MTAITVPLGMLPALGGLLDPVRGIWNGAENAEYPATKIVDGEYSGTVYRDGLGIAHIFTTTYENFSYIMGYLQATDRLFSMDMQKRLIGGRLAEIVGLEALVEDKFARIFGFKRAGIQLWEKILDDAPGDPELQLVVRAVNAYCEGVNKHVNEIMPNNLPLEYVFLGIEPEPWTPFDVMSLIKYQSYALSFNEYDLIMQMIKDAMGEAVAYELAPSTPYEFEKVVVPDFTTPMDGGTPKSAIAPEQVITGVGRNFAGLKKIVDVVHQFNEISGYNQVALACSNNWVVNGTLTDTGYPILCNDPHLPLMLPSIWWEFHFVNVSNPSDVVYGVSFPGTPIAEIGHTTRIAWGATVTAYDQNDFYAETFRNDGEQYLFNGNVWRDVEKVTETIKVKGRPDEVMTVKFTRHNLTIQDDFPCPIIDANEFGIAGTDMTPIAMKWTGFAPDYGIIKGFFRLNKAKNIDDYLDAMEVYNCPGQNFIYADIDGNIAMYPKARYPVRNATGIVGEGM
nr:penicillin acylase family protein [Candidatus Sigynarchaeota archaeon]